MKQQRKTFIIRVACLCAVLSLIRILSELQLEDFTSKWNRGVFLAVRSGPYACNMTFPLMFRQLNYNSSRDDCRPITRRNFSPFPMTALASFPGSGNTWFRHLVQQATGVATGSIYCDGDLSSHGFPGECFHDQSVILVKTHDFKVHEQSKYQRAILIIRDPRETLRADFNRRYSKGSSHIGHASEEQFQLDFAKFWRRGVKKWHNFNTNWLHFHGPLQVVRYENLLSNLVDEMQRVFKFLNQTVLPCDMCCMVANREGRYHRGARNLERDYLDLTRNMEIGQFIEHAYKTYNQLLSIRSEEIPIWNNVSQVH